MCGVSIIFKSKEDLQKEARTATIFAVWTVVAMQCLYWGLILLYAPSFDAAVALFLTTISLVASGVPGFLVYLLMGGLDCQPMPADRRFELARWIQAHPELQAYRDKVVAEHREFTLDEYLRIKRWAHVQHKNQAEREINEQLYGSHK